MSRMIARDQVDTAAAETGCTRVYRDENRDQYERDGELITVDYKLNNSIRKAWINNRYGERVINGTSKLRKVLSYMRTELII